MIKYITSILLILNSLLIAKYEDNSPTLTTKNDLEILKGFENLIYDETKFSNYKCDISSITNLIYSNKKYDFDYSRLTINIHSQINNEERFSDNNGTIQDRDRASIQLQATYPIYDKKTDIEIQKKKVEFKSKLLDNVSKYCELKNDISILTNKLNLLNLKQLRAKAREDSGQIYLDDRITLIEEIIDTKNQISKYNLTIENLKLQLLNLIKKSKSKKLKEML